MIRYTPEQDEVLEHAMTEDGILLVQAGAGSGKSFMAKQITKELKPSKGLYTAFNKAIVVEGVSRFKGTNMECKTLHALAYKYVNPQRNISDLSYKCIEEDISYTDKNAVITGINDFFVSNSVDMYEFFELYYGEYPDPKKYIDLASKYVDKMVAGELDPTFNFLLKYFHLMLVEKTVEVKYDLVILDEINDTTAVSLEIFKLITAPKKIGLGETNQAIYQFLNLVDGFEELSDHPQLRLTQSWRCSTEIAEKIEKFMITEANKDFRFVGTDDPVRNGLTLFVTRTNARIIEEISRRLEQGESFHLLRKISDIFAVPLAIVSASAGKIPYQKKYLFLHDEYKNWVRQGRRGSFQSYLMNEVDDEEIHNAVNLLQNFRNRGINIFDVYKKAKEVRPDKSYTIATVFTSKGLEYETVYIAEDLNQTIKTVRDNGGIKTIEDLVSYRCYYVACSRAGVNLYNANALKY